MQKIFSAIAALLFFQSFSAMAIVRDSVTLTTSKGNIYGTLSLPDKKFKGPVVIIIAGSGPTDRDGNSGIMLKNNSLKMLSDSLAKYGIASLRYDKRGIGASKAAAPDERNLRFGDYVNDVEDWAKLLGKDKRFSQVFVAGHSEGSLIGMIAVQKVKTAGYISIAGAGKPADQVILDQLEGNASQTAIDSCRIIFAGIKDSGKFSPVPGGVYQQLFRPSVQPYIQSWIQFDPSQEIKKVKTPTLIIQGTKDLQVDTAQTHLLAAAKPDAKMVIIPNMNHIFKNVSSDDKGDNISTYYDPELPINSMLVQSLVRFIRTNCTR